MNYAQIFQLLALIFIAVGLGIMINPGLCKRLVEDFTASLPSLFLASLLVIVFGFVLAVNYATWTIGWQMIIPIIGWLAVIKGLTILIFPNFYVFSGRSIIKNESVLIFCSGIVLMMGIGMLALGFLAF